jgi:hypothetical protein
VALASAFDEATLFGVGGDGLAGDGCGDLLLVAWRWLL